MDERYERLLFGLLDDIAADKVYGSLEHTSTLADLVRLGYVAHRVVADCGHDYRITDTGRKALDQREADRR